jgi:hypothetical protein
MEINNNMLDSKQKNKQSKYHRMTTKVAAIQHSFIIIILSLQYGKSNNFQIQSWMPSKENKLQF